MAYKNISKLTTRRQGEIIGQIFRLIACYSEFFVSRTRVYIKDIGKQSNTVYWLEHPKNNEVTAIAIIDPNYTIPNPYGESFKILGHTIAKLSNQMNTILDHIMGDHEQDNIVFFTRELFGQALSLEDTYQFICFTHDELKDTFAGLAELSTEYFALTQKENIVEAMKRRSYNLYIKFNADTLESIRNNNNQLHSFISKKLSHVS